MMLPTYWTLEEALPIIRALQPDSRRFGYHLCLGGGVLNKGRSDKDLDLYFLPMDNGEPCKQEGLLDWLEGLWGEGEVIGSAEYGPFQLTGNGPFVSEWVRRYPKTLSEAFVQLLDAVAMRRGLRVTSKYYMKMKYQYGGLRIDVFVM